MSLRPAQLAWYIHPDAEKFPAVGIVRDHKGGALVIGGPTGSHYTGHGESWAKKEQLVRAMGYAEVSEARESKKLPVLWRPPSIAEGDAELIEKIRNGIL